MWNKYSLIKYVISVSEFKIWSKHQKRNSGRSIPEGKSNVYKFSELVWLQRRMQILRGVRRVTIVVDRFQNIYPTCLILFQLFSVTRPSGFGISTKTDVLKSAKTRRCMLTIIRCNRWLSLRARHTWRPVLWMEWLLFGILM